MKKIILIIILLGFGFLLVSSIIPQKVNDYSTQVFNSSMQKFNMPINDENTLQSIGFFAETILATILFVLPISVVGGVWFAKIAHDLLVKKMYFEIFPKGISFVLGLIAIFLAIYSIYSQYKILSVVIDKNKVDEIGKQDESRLI